MPTQREIVRKLKNPLYAGIFLVLVLTAVWHFKHDWWLKIFTIILSYFIADTISNLIIKNRNNIIRIPSLGNLTQAKGYGLIFFVLSIIVGAVGSAILVSQVSNFSGNPMDLQSGLIINSIIIIAAYIDFRTKTYGS